jgi:hypothetical protein
MDRSQKSGSGLSRQAPGRPLVFGVLLSVLAACSSQSAREAAVAEAEVANMAAEQAAAREAAEIERQQAEAEERRRLAEAEERERRLAQERQAAEVEARAEAQRLAREQAERAERERRAAVAAARAERQEKMDRIAALEQQIADIQAELDSDSEQALIMQQAIAAAEELLAALTAEVAKYELTDESGNTIEPLSKDLIAELEARKDELVERARGL